MKYRAEIDGLRAIAVIPVVFYRAGFDVLKGGFVGVDIFFVISGYLITTIIKTELDEDRFSLVQFYERRARRILPALFLVILVALPLAWIWLPPRAMEEFLQSIFSVSLFSSNIFFWQESGYFDTATELKPLLHTWTLAIEEQYYILFPLFLMFMKPFGTRRTFIVLVVALVMSLGLAQWGSSAKPVATFYLLPTRAWELAIGSLVAFQLMYSSWTPSRMVSQGASLAGFALIVFSVFAYSADTPYPSLYTAAPTLGTALVILFARPGTWVKALLSLKVLVGIGLISYSAYLWHQPLLVFARYQFAIEGPSMFVMASLAILTFILAYLSWKYVETPFRKRALYSRGQVFRASAAGIAACMSLGVVGMATNGKLLQPDATTYHVELLDYNPDNRTLQEATWDPLRDLSGDPHYRVDNNPFDRTLWFDLDDERPRLLLVGNSFSKDLYNVLSFSEVSKVFQLARYGVQTGHIDETFFGSPNYVNADVIILASKNNWQDLKHLETVLERFEADGKIVAILRNIVSFDEHLGGTLTLADIAVIEQTRAGIEDGDTIRDEADERYYEDLDALSRERRSKPSVRLLDDLSVQFPRLIQLDRMGYACALERATCYSMDEKLNKFFYDYGHHTLVGARFFGRRIDRIGWFDPVYEAISDAPPPERAGTSGTQDLR